MSSVVEGDLRLRPPMRGGSGGIMPLRRRWRRSSSGIWVWPAADDWTMAAAAAAAATSWAWGSMKVNQESGGTKAWDDLKAYMKGQKD